MASGPAVIGFDGTAAAERAVREAGGLLAPRRALVVVAIEEGATFGAVLAPVLVAGLPATELEIRNAVRAEGGRDRAGHQPGAEGRRTGKGGRTRGREPRRLR